MRARTAVLGVVCLSLGLPVAAQPADEVALVKSVFAKLQLISIRQNRELCGYIGFNAGGDLIASRASLGEEGSCQPTDPEDIDLITASYHTHGAFSPDYVNEVPSVEDIESDADEGIDGYVATPGGRLWFVDTEAMSIEQLCGLGCLMQDPSFVPGRDGPIADYYRYDELVDLLAD